MKLKVTLERSGAQLWGRIENRGDFLPVTAGKNVSDVISKLRNLIRGYQRHEGKKDKKWNQVDVSSSVFVLEYDVQSFFIENSYLKQSKIAELAGMNPGLIRQYASGLKHPSVRQAKKIESAIHKVAKELREVSIH